MAKTKAPKPGLSLRVEGTKIELSARFVAEGSSSASSLAMSKAGGTGFSFSSLCGTCRAPLKAPRVCEEHGIVPKENQLKGYDVGGGSFAVLTQTQVDALKPSGDDTINVVALLDRSAVGFVVGSEMARLMGNVRALVPNTTGADAKQQELRWSAFLALLGASRVGVAAVMSKGSFRYMLLSPAKGGAVLAFDLYLPEDTYGVPEVSVAVLSEEHRAAFEKKGEELAAGLIFADVDVASDPYREARAEAITATLLGKVDVEIKAPVAAPAREEDLLAML